MTDSEFIHVLWRRAYTDQIAGYSLGHPKREGFNPIVPSLQTPDGHIDRAGTLEMPCYRLFTAEERQVLLETDRAT